MEDNYDKILERISRSSGEDKKEIDRKVEAKRAKLSGLISREGAAQIVASELGISFDNERLKINELLSGMRKIKVIGKIIDLSPVRTFTRNGKKGKVVNFTLADDTSNIKVVLWDVNHIELIEKGKIKKEDVVEISNGGMRGNEIHLGSFSELKPIKEEIKEVITEKMVFERKIEDVQISENVNIRAFIVNVFGPRFFETCPECNKKVQRESEGSICKDHGKVIPNKRALLNLVLDDGTEVMRSVVFSENFEKIGIKDLEDSDKITNQKEDLLGKEMFFIGNVKNNKFFNNKEIIIEDVLEVDTDELIKKLEKKQTA